MEHAFSWGLLTKYAQKPFEKRNNFWKITKKKYNAIIVL